MTRGQTLFLSFACAAMFALLLVPLPEKPPPARGRATPERREEEHAAGEESSGHGAGHAYRVADRGTPTRAPLTAGEVEMLLATGRETLREEAFAEIRRTRSKGVIDVAVEYARQRGGSDGAQALFWAKQSGLAHASRALAELFAASSDELVKATIVAAFRFHPAQGDRELLEQMRLVAGSDALVAKIDALLEPAGGR